MNALTEMIYCSSSRFMQAYREGATGMDVLEKTKAIKKSHRVPLLLEQQPREAYSSNRVQRVAKILAGRG